MWTYFLKIAFFFIIKRKKKEEISEMLLLVSVFLGCCCYTCTERETQQINLCCSLHVMDRQSVLKSKDHTCFVCCIQTAYYLSSLQTTNCSPVNVCLVQDKTCLKLDETLAVKLMWLVVQSLWPLVLCSCCLAQCDRLLCLLWNAIITASCTRFNLLSM